MQIIYDKEASAMNVSLRKGQVAKTVEVAPDVILDYNKKGEVLGVEILGV